MDALYEKLLYGGGYSLPYLLHLYDGPGDGSAADAELFLVNDARDLEWGGHVWRASAFEFVPADDGESTLRVMAQETGIRPMLDGNYSFNAEFTGILLEDGSVTEIRNWRRRYGTARWDGKEAEVTFEPDDRLKMTFPALIFNASNNRGNQ